MRGVGINISESKALLPHSIEAEQGVVGSILQSPGDTIAECVATGITAHHFYVPAHRTIYTALLDMWDSNEAIDLITFTQFLRDQNLLDSVGGAAFVTNLFTFVPTAANVQYYLEIVRDKFTLRETRRAAEIAIQRTNEAQGEPEIVLNELESRIASLRSLHGKNGSKPPKPLIEFRSPLQLKDFVPPPGLVLVGDFHIAKGNVFVIGGAPGIGKSRGAVSLAVAGASQDDWFGLTVHCKFKVLIVQNENGEFRLSRDFAQLNCQALDDYVRICPPPPYGFCFARAEFRAQLAAAIADFKPDIVIFDPWNAVAYEQDSREYLDTFDALKSVLPLGDAAPALGIVAHTRKPKTDERASGRGLLNLLAGSYVLGSVPRTVFVMQAASDDTTDDRIVWTCCKNNDGQMGPRSAWERRNGLFAPVFDFDWKAFDAPYSDRRQTITENDVAEVFADGPLPKTEAAKRLQENTGASKATAYRALDLNGRFKNHLQLEKGLWMWK
jgi:DnaB-like helicase N terminal domain/AAA domain